MFLRKRDWTGVVIPVVVSLAITLSILAFFVIITHSIDSMPREDWPPRCAPIATGFADICEARETKFSGYWGLGSLIVAFVTLITVFVGFWQNNTTQQTEFRAYLRIKIANMLLRENRSVRLTLKPINYGKTPAENVWYAYQARVAPVGTQISLPLKPSNLPKAGATVHPEADDIIFPIEILEIDQMQMEQLREGQLILVVAVETFYRDVFGKNHTTSIHFYQIYPWNDREETHFLETGNWAD